MQNSAVDEILELVRNWSMADLQALRDDLEAILRERERAEPLLDIREFRGIGHGTWTDVGGVDEFIGQERASWDDPGRAISELQVQTQHSITELRGVGKEFWQGIDVEEFIKQERASWDA